MTGLKASPGPLQSQYDHALVDLDGVAYRGPEPIPHAAKSLNTAKKAGLGLTFVTNNASREPEAVAEQLTTLGIPTHPNEVMTAAQAGAQLLATRLKPGAKVLVVGGAGLRTAVTAAGFEIVASANEEPDAVVQGFAPEVGWADLAEAAYAVAAGAWFVASNRDLSLPTARGYAPGNGALVAAVTAATGVTPDSAGKPEPTMYHLAASRAEAKKVLVIGDRLDTDLAGARAGDYDGLHVLTGVNDVRDAVLAPAALRPHYLALDLRGLQSSHAAPEREGDWWTCQGAAAQIRDGRLVLADGVGTDSLDRARAACAAVWEAVDQGHQIAADSVPSSGDLLGL